MKKNIRYCFAVALLGWLLTSNWQLYGQDSAAPQVTIPFDSLQVHDVNSTGNLSTGAVTISMRFENRYADQVRVHFTLGGFAEFGLTDNTGKTYKVYTSENLIGATDINKGYGKISSVGFGPKKMEDFTYVEQRLAPGESKTLTVQVDKVDKRITALKEFHIRCRLSIDYMAVGDKLYKVEGLKVNWIKPGNKM